MRYLSICDGIGAAHQAFKPLGWRCVGASEIEPFPIAVVSHNHPEVKHLGDMNNYHDWDIEQPDLICGGTPCFPGHVPVVTKRGILPINEVRVGDVVFTHKNRWRAVVATGSKMADTIVLVGQGQSNGLETTREHPFYACEKSRIWVGRENGSYAPSLGSPQWVEAQNMTGMMWASPAHWPVSSAPPIETAGRERNAPEMSEELAWIIGRWLGDGWCRINERRGYVLVCCGKKETSTVSERLRVAGLVFSKSNERTTTRFQIANRAFAKWLTFNFGSGAASKTMPSWVYGWQYRASFLAGYLSADGCRTPNGMRLTTVSNHLALATVLLAHSLGKSASRILVNPSRASAEIEGRKVSERPFWQVSIYDKARSSMERDGHRWGLVRKAHVGRRTLVYNLEVDEDNSYLADGIVVHNCQSFSVAGLRKGMADPRGNLSLVFLGIVDHFRPRWVVWENVPGVLSSNGGRDFGSFLGALGQLGYGFAYRVLDAQYAGLAQRRKRVFVVAHLGDWRRAAAVLFERHSLSGNPAPSRGKGEGTAGTLSARTSGGGGLGTDFECGGGLQPIAIQERAVSENPNAGPQGKGWQEDIGFTLEARHHSQFVFDPAQITSKATRSNPQPGDPLVPELMPSMTTRTGTGVGNSGMDEYVVPCLIRMREGGGGGKGPLVSEDQSLTLATGNDQVLAIRTDVTPKWGEIGFTLTQPSPSGGGQPAAVMTGMQVRRLTPVETSRLQGFPDTYCHIPTNKWRKIPADEAAYLQRHGLYAELRGEQWYTNVAADGPIYKGHGNSWAVPVVRWIGERINLVDELVPYSPDDKPVDEAVTNRKTIIAERESLTQTSLF